MARKKKQEQSQEPSSQTASGEQLDLMDVGPENMKEILPVAMAYKHIVTQRVELTAKEVELKTKVRSFVHNSGLKPLADGTFKFTCNGVTIEVKPRDEKVTVKVKEDGD